MSIWAKQWRYVTKSVSQSFNMGNQCCRWAFGAAIEHSNWSFQGLIASVWRISERFPVAKRSEWSIEAFAMRNGDWNVKTTSIGHVNTFTWAKWGIDAHRGAIWRIYSISTSPHTLVDATQVRHSVSMVWADRYDHLREGSTCSYIQVIKS